MLRRDSPLTEHELWVRAMALRQRTVAELARGLGVAEPAEPRRAKGFVGQLVEAALGADPRAFDAPDFPALGIELKTVPVRASGRPAETTFCCSVTMAGADAESWESSRLRRRLRRVLWVPLDGASVAPLSERRFHPPVLWSPSAEEDALLKADWEDLMGRVGSGGLVRGELGRVLQLRPKARDSHVRTLGLGERGHAKIAPVGFYLRTDFTARILSPAAL